MFSCFLQNSTILHHIFSSGIKYDQFDQPSFSPGHCAHPDDIIIDGDLQEMKFTAYFCEGERVKAVVSTSNVTAAFAEYLSAGNILSKAEVIILPHLLLKFSERFIL